MAEIVNTFYLIDSNEDGRLSKKELNDAAFMIGMNPTTKELDAWWKEADINGQSDIKHPTQISFLILYSYCI